MALCINQAGTYRNTTSLCVNQAGTYRTIVDGCINQAGTYRYFGMTAPTGSLSVSPSSGSSGSSATLTWSSTRATSVVSTSNFSTSATGGTTTATNITSTRTFSITFGNSFANSAAATATFTVVPAPTISSFTASPSSIANGGSSTLSWTSSNATSASIDQGIGSVATSGSSVRSGLTVTTTFTLTVTNSVGVSVTATRTVTVVLPVPGALGSSFGGGFVICKPGSSPAWVVSPQSAEVSRTWYLRNDANTRAQSVSGCTGWFVPTRPQLQNPGYCCRSFRGPSPCFSAANYWSSSEFIDTHAISVRYANGNADSCTKTFTSCVRAFRCVTY